MRIFCRLMIFLWVLTMPVMVWAQSNNAAAPPPAPQKLADAIAPYLQQMTETEQSSDEVVFDEEESEKLSHIEQWYQKRSGERLLVYGHNFWQNQKSNSNIDQNRQPIGAVQDDFVLGVGDKLKIFLRGQSIEEHISTITPTGEIMVAGLPPISAVGQTLKSFRQAFKKAVAEKMIGVQANVSLAQIRQVGILVTGLVQKPGQYQLSAFHTIFDALREAGGLQKTASLRHMTLIRYGQKKSVDLYNIIHGKTRPQDWRLKDGDQIIVQPLGATIAIAGAVAQPAIFEIKPTDRFKQLLDYSGQGLGGGKQRFVLKRVDENGMEEAKRLTLDSLSRVDIEDGDLLLIEQNDAAAKNQITVSGNPRLNGSYSLHDVQTLRSLLQNHHDLAQGTYPAFALIKRQNIASLTPTYLAFSPLSILNKTQNFSLHNQDDVMFFSFDDLAFLNRSKVQEKQDNRDPYKQESKPAQNNLVHHKKNPLIHDDIKKIIESYAVPIRGAVHNPGLYPIAHPIPLKDAIAIAGNPSHQANQQKIEVTFAQSQYGVDRLVYDLKTQHIKPVMIGAQDAIRVAQKEAKIDTIAVRITGEIISPGEYDVKRGDTIYDVIQRAGGLTDYAYPDAAIFMRESEKRRKKRYFEQAALQLEQSIAAFIMSPETNKKQKSDISFAKKLTESLKATPVAGRIVVEADPVLLKKYPERDTLLQPGDRLHIPRRTNTVMVSGEVLSPAALLFDQKKEALDYIRASGGTTRFADRDKAFVVYPDGSSSPLRVSSWNYQSNKIPPGSTIIVPRDPEPFKFFNIASGIGNILSQLAITSVAIAEISDD